MNFIAFFHRAEDRALFEVAAVGERAVVPRLRLSHGAVGVRALNDERPAGGHASAELSEDQRNLVVFEGAQRVVPTPRALKARGAIRQRAKVAPYHRPE